MRSDDGRESAQFITGSDGAVSQPPVGPGTRTAQRPGQAQSQVRGGVQDKKLKKAAPLSSSLSRVSKSLRENKKQMPTLLFSSVKNTFIVLFTLITQWTKTDQILFPCVNTVKHVDKRPCKLKFLLCIH